MSNRYWQTVAEETLGEFDIALSDEQIERMAYMLEGSHESYSLYTGEEVVEKNYRAWKDRELVESGARAVLNYTESLVQDVFNGADDIFPLLNHRAKIAMHKLNNIEEFYKKEG